MTDDQRLLAEIENLLVSGSTVGDSVLEQLTKDDPDIVMEDFRRNIRFLRTDPALIIPDGSGRAYSLDPSGNVTGIKLSFTYENPQAIFDLICRFASLERLVFYSDIAYEVPVSIQNLKKLRFMSIGGKAKQLPPEVLAIELPIYAGRSEIMSLLEERQPKAVKEMMALESRLERRREFIERHVSENDELESRLSELRKKHERQLIEWQYALSGIFIDSLALEDPPLEIAAKGRDAIATYFQQRGSDVLPINELKVLLVGNGSAGKTSLVKRLLGEAFNPKESQTHGINIRSWPVSTPSGKDVKLNFWDFGGQEIMHATHQFFLSKRSMYILVLDGRKEEDPEYWLQHIESFGGDSPIMIVLNKIDEHPAFEVNRKFLQEKYRGIVGIFRVSCASGGGIEDFKGALVRQLDTASMLQTLWPRNWFKVKQRLEGLKTSYVSLKEYRAVCDEENVREQDNQETLVDFLNDLGVVLHFKDMELLDTHVLDPRWVTEAVYRVITSELLANQKGILRLNQLREALKPRQPGTCVYPTDKHQYIIDLMLKFELCYRLDKKAILVPDLLDIQEPGFDFDYDEALRFVFEYTYLPKSIMPRFIVRVNQDIKKDKRWRTGVMLEEESFGATALVRTDEKAKRINVYVTGKQKRDYFATVRKVIKDINASFEKLGVTEYVPLPDVPDVLIDYRDLLGHEIAGRDEYFVGKLGRPYNVQSLLNGIEAKTSRLNSAPTQVYVQGTYIGGSQHAGAVMNVNDNRGNMGNGGDVGYKPQNWEKVIVYITGFLFIGLVGFLLVRNQPIADKNLVVALRVIISLVVAVFAAVVPGMLRVDMSVKGLTIRAIGALAVFVLTFVLTPKVL